MTTILTIFDILLISTLLWLAWKLLASEDIFKAVDKVVAIMTRQIERHKGKVYDKGRGNSLARGEFSEASKPARKIVKKKRFVMESMLVEEAMEQMESLGHSFFLFFDGVANNMEKPRRCQTLIDLLPVIISPNALFNQFCLYYVYLAANFNQD